MITIKSITKFDKAHATVITIGTFDGVHIGHKKILERLINSAKLLEIESTVLTFFPHPRMVLQQDSNIKLLNTIEEKEMILSNLGLDFLIIHPFSKEFSRLSAIEFVRDILVNKLNTKKIIIGYDHRFGRNRNADINDLKNYGTTFDFNVEEITAQEIDDVSVSSTKIRKALAEGDVSKANSYLGYNYMLTGIVTKGKGLGRQLNFPTANIYIKEEYKLIPKNGVYVVKAKLNNSTVFGMMNIGYNPTVNGTEKTIEVNFFNFNDDLYGKKIQVDILERIRDEVKFDSINDLKVQLTKDQETATSLIAKL
ncbi:MULTISPECIES: bifunctional riboflavin kinase/FAD synthetase [Cellulophaga]|uniref:Riboflavin biosynthesis protein n=2 Tax=Cellulophaga TaxID=104264 RepID=F0RBH1_CELLC|nr:MULTISPECIES: bifunctional riboflavin kinase/FAD synthetase [Cellulophaga]ADY29593.1 riboflavin biosynthesis protein RibF [Cellulophaga lytica DSM 7489]EWH12482.1 riboflavin biosynthesis protein RibF [Cellulophaga geojensis KL-A]TVZ07860.1 riboflavin kinase/FMN adenylyltransferase [Cellulophaga sp. RHA_52]WQG76236.1 bifunctional riboflavin kinase/FAD synthetase [Cellulophaga lytica]